MKLYHIGFSREDLGQNTPTMALLCGDPERARMIAEIHLRNYRLLSEHRGLYCYVGELRDGQMVLSATSGMGASSLSIVVNELVQIGIRTVIRVGTTGSIQPAVHAGSVVITRAALCRQGAANDIAPVEYPAAADPFITVALVNAARKLHIPYHLGLTASVDTFYEGQERIASSANANLLRSLHGVTDEYRKLGILNYEMECGTLFKMGGVYGFSAGSVCGVIAERVESENVALSSKTIAVDNAINVAVAALSQLVQE